jgi:hypothetical protein
VNDIRALFPIQIVRGALLRPDGIAVGLVVGGAPPWDLRSLAGRSQAGDDYHRLLLALDAPVDVYLVDEPPNLAGAIATLVERHERCRQSVLAAVLSELIDELAERAQHSSGRAKQVIWAVTAAPQAAAPSMSGLRLGALLGLHRKGQRHGTAPAHQSALAQAVERARRLADALAQLGGTPTPRLMEAEEIARLIYQLADPVRAQRYPLAGALLDRVRRIVTHE